MLPLGHANAGNHVDPAQAKVLRARLSNAAALPVVFPMPYWIGRAAAAQASGTPECEGTG
jgi:hypothetical protein